MLHIKKLIGMHNKRTYTRVLTYAYRHTRIRKIRAYNTRMRSSDLSELHCRWPVIDKVTAGQGSAVNQNWNLEHSAPENIHGYPPIGRSMESPRGRGCHKPIDSF